MYLSDLCTDNDEFPMMTTPVIESVIEFLFMGDDGWEEAEDDE